MKKLSVCIICYNEEENIRNTYDRVTAVMRGLSGYDYEIIFADNASRDSSEKILKELAKQDRRVKVILNYRNYGPQRSQRNACSRASGDAIITLPCDLQEPPELIPTFVQEWENGNLIVWGQKTSSRESRFKYFLRGIYYKIIQKLSEVPQYEQVTGFGIMDRTVFQEMQKCDEYEMAVRHLVADLGYPVKLIPYTQEKRKKGKSSYNVWRYLNFAVNSLVTTSRIPLRLITVFGAVCSVLSFICGVIYLVYKLLYWDRFAMGTAPLIIAIFFLGAVQLLTVGIIGEYVGAIFQRIKKRPLVLEREIINFEEQE